MHQKKGPREEGPTRFSSFKNGSLRESPAREAIRGVIRGQLGSNGLHQDIQDGEERESREKKGEKRRSRARKTEYVYGSELKIKRHTKTCRSIPREESRNRCREE